MPPFARWMARTFPPPSERRTRPTRRPKLGLEALESREVPSVTTYDRDFEPNKTATLAPGVTAAWSQTGKSTSPSGQTFLGEFGNQTVTLKLNNLPSHNQLTVEFDLYLIRSWDGNDPVWGGPNGDRWSLKADGATLLDTTFRTPRTLPTSDYGQEFGGQGVTGPGPFAPGTAAAAVNTLGYTFNGGNGNQLLDTTYHFSYPINHTGSTLTLAFAGSGLQGLSDESWGLDNVKVVSSTAPVIYVGDQQNIEGDNICLQTQVSSGDNAILTYSATNLPTGLSINPSTGVIIGTISAGTATGGDDGQGDYAVVVTATDGTYTGTTTVAWAVSQRIAVQLADQLNVEGDSVSAQSLATTPDNATSTFSASNLPAGLNINPTTGAITGTVAAGDSTGGSDGQGIYAVTITATDGTYAGTTTITWAVSSPIDVLIVGSQENIEGDSINLPVTVFAPDTTSLTFSASNLPSGLSINPTTGVISGIIAAGTAAGGDNGLRDYDVTITVTDGTYTGTAAIDWTVSSRIAFSVVSAQQNALTTLQSVEGSSVSLEVRVGSPVNASPIFSVTNLPAGLSINPATGAITGTIAVGTATGGDDGNGIYTVLVIGTDGTYTGTTTITWTIITNTVPVTAANAYTTPSGGTLTVAAAGGVLANDTGASGAPLTASLVPGSVPQHGTVTLNADGSFVYTPDPSFVQGTDTFQYTASSGSLQSGPTLVTISVRSANTAPIAVSDSYDIQLNADQNTFFVSAQNGILANDTDPDGDKLTAQLLSGPISGTLVLNADGSFAYTPAAGFTGEVSFSYWAFDGALQSLVPATVLLKVQPKINPTPFTEQLREGMRRDNEDKWDRNIDGKLTLDEIVQATQRKTSLGPGGVVLFREVTGDQAAAIAILSRYYIPLLKTEQNIKRGLTLAEIEGYEKYAALDPTKATPDQKRWIKIVREAEADFQNAKANAAKLPTELAPGTEPTNVDNTKKIAVYELPTNKQLINAVTQGDSGSCAFLSGIINLLGTGRTGTITVTVNLDPNTVNTWAYMVKFAGAKEVAITKPTQTQQLRYASAGQNGLWLSVLEKAYVQYRGTIFGNKVGDSVFSPTPWLSGDMYNIFGDFSTSVVHLLTGRDRANMVVYSNLFQNQINAKTLVAHLMKVIDNNANTPDGFKPLTVMAIGGTYKESILAKSYYNDPKWEWTANPDELPPAHALAIIGYNPTTKQLLIRNPHNKPGAFGNEFKMSVDDFVKAFGTVVFEK